MSTLRLPIESAQPLIRRIFTGRGRRAALACTRVRRRRRIGARAPCNPALAHTALQKDPRVGVLLPSNVVLYENDDGSAVVGAVDPMQTLGASGPEGGLDDLARDVGARLERVLEDLAS